MRGPAARCDDVTSAAPPLPTPPSGSGREYHPRARPHPDAYKAPPPDAGPGRPNLSAGCRPGRSFSPQGLHGAGRASWCKTHPLTIDAPGSQIAQRTTAAPSAIAPPPAKERPRPVRTAGQTCVARPPGGTRRCSPRTRDAGALAHRHQAGAAAQAPADVPGPERPPSTTRAEFQTAHSTRHLSRWQHAAADTRTRRPGWPPTARPSRLHPAAGLPRRMPESRFSESTLWNRAQPPVRPRRMAARTRPPYILARWRVRPGVPGLAAGISSVECPRPTGTFAQSARIAFLRINPMEPRTTPGPTAPRGGADKTPYTLARWRLRPGVPGLAAGISSVECPRPTGTPAQSARIAFLRTNPMEPRTTPSPTAPFGGADKTPYTLARWHLRSPRPAQPTHAATTTPYTLAWWRVRPGPPGWQPASPHSSVRDPTALPRKVPESRFSEPTLWNRAQPPVRPRRVAARTRHPTPSHGGASGRVCRGWLAAGISSVERPRPTGTPAQSARIAFLRTNPMEPRQPPVRPRPGQHRQDPIHPRTVAPPVAPARAANARGDKHPMHPRTVARPAGSAGLAADISSVECPRPTGTLAQSARIAFLRINPMGSDTEVCPTASADRASKSPMHPGTVPHPVGPAALAAASLSVAGPCPARRTRRMHDTRFSESALWAVPRQSARPRRPTAPAKAPCTVARWRPPTNLAAAATRLASRGDGGPPVPRR